MPPILLLTAPHTQAIEILCCLGICVQPNHKLRQFDIVGFEFQLTLRERGSARSIVGLQRTV
jgi:hypothetical protein